VSVCPYCGHEAADARAEIVHMTAAHPDVVQARLQAAGLSVREAGPLAVDLQRLVDLAHDLAYYRSVDDDGGLGHCAWIELRDAVSALPEAAS
jgi:hypothetical protein